MKKSIWLMVFTFVFSALIGGVDMSKTYAAEDENGGKAILVVSFGTTYADTRKVTIDAVADKIQSAFPDYEVRQAFTSRIIVKKLAERDSLQIDTEKQALEKLKEEGYSEVLIQPLHIEAGDEYDKLMKVVDQYKDSFDKLSVGRPLLYYTGQEGVKPDDYTIAINAIKAQLPKTGAHEAVAFMGHGGVHPSNTAYAALQMKLQDAGLNNVYIFTVEGYPSFEDMVGKMKAAKIEKVTLMPFMVVAGDHAKNDMAGDEKDSFKSQLLEAGFKVDAYLHGLGENAGIQDIYVQHVKDAQDDKYKARSKDRPAIPVIE